MAILKMSLEKNTSPFDCVKVKVGAQIMIVNNDSRGIWVNGSIGKVMDIVHSKEEGDYIFAKLSNDSVVEIFPYTWKIFRFFAENGELKSEVIGTFTQFPFVLAWAVTICKGQGKHLLTDRFMLPLADSQLLKELY
ncbi:MAG: hypothetical protein ACUVUG_09000 [Candidatus Aminicenantia bacterium]